MKMKILWMSYQTSSYSPWNVITSCLMWCIWKEMNVRSFEDCEKTSSELQLCFLKSLFVNALLNIYSFVGFCAFFLCP
jgi:hypothetical protein